MDLLLYVFPVSQFKTIWQYVARITHFVDVVLLDDVIEEAVELVEQRHHLHGRADGAHGGEAHNVREEDSHVVVGTRLYRLPGHQLVRDVPADKRTAT